MSNNTGWICPKCEDVYAPYVQGCLKCNKKDESTSLQKLNEMYNQRCTNCNEIISNLDKHDCKLWRKKSIEQWPHDCFNNLPMPNITLTSFNKENQ